MIDKNDILEIEFLNNLPKEIISKIASIGEIQTLEKDTVVFRQGEPQDAFYSLLSGKIVLNCKTGTGNVYTLDEVHPGRCFGVSSLLGEISGSFTAVCIENSKIIKLSGSKMQQLFEEDSSFGFSVMLQVVRLFKSRMDGHTEQFINSLSNHPMIKKIL